MSYHKQQLFRQAFIDAVCDNLPIGGKAELVTPKYTLEVKKLEKKQTLAASGLRTMKMNNALGPCPLCGDAMTFGYCEGYKEPGYYSPGCLNSNCLLFHDGGPTFNSEDEVLKALEKIRKRGERMSKRDGQLKAHLDAATDSMQLAMYWAVDNGRFEALTTVLWQTLVNAQEYIRSLEEDE